MSTPTKRALVIGASRTLGLGLVRELAARGWEVTGTVRGDARTGLHELAEADARVRVARADLTDQADLDRLRSTLPDGSLDLLYISAGITDPDIPASQVPTDVFEHVMVTNALAPLRAIETLAPLVRDDGTIGVMTSRQGSVSLNERGGHEVYRASKAALNQLLRSYDARRTDARTLVLIHPGWVQTELGGEGAPLTIEESVPGIVDVLDRHAGDGGLQFRSYTDEVIPW
jgi:NAD(P)-dependent dehydrogenase (short-subunit alcohol dehydrogenase family)